MSTSFPSYNTGDLVQLISVEEFDSFPKDPRNDLKVILGKGPTGHLDFTPSNRRSLCGCIARIKRFMGHGFITGLPLYELEPYDISFAFDLNFTAAYIWQSCGFTPNEFHPYTPPALSISPLSFDDLLQGGA